MQIGKADSPSGAVTASPVVATAVKAATPTSSTTNTTATGTVAAPLSGGLRTVPAALFVTENQDTGDNGLTVADFADMVAQKTQSFAKTLTEALQGANLPTNEPLVLHVDSNGTVTVDGPYKERMEKFFKEHPDLGQQLREVSALNTLVALNEALRRFAAAKDAARSDKDRDQAQAAYLDDCLGIQARSGTMVLADGQLASTAVGFMAGH